jgi:hypothetical protein
LRSDVENLKPRLIGMEGIAESLYGIISSLPNVPAEVKSAVKDLHKAAEQYQLPPQLRTAAEIKPNATELYSTKNTKTVPTSFSVATSEVSSTSATPSRHLIEDESPAQSSQPSSTIDNLSLIDDFQDLQTPQPYLGPSMWRSGSFSQSHVAFSMRLRHEALKGAYDLVAKPETSYQSLCKVFRHCIFSCSRDDLVKHLDFLIQESAKTSYQTILMSMAMPSPDREFPTPNCDATAGAVRPEETDEGYMDPEGVCNYLSEMGLAIDPESSFVEVSMTSRSSVGAPTTLFDEMRQKVKIRISVSRLLHGENDPCRIAVEIEVN